MDMEDKGKDNAGSKPPFGMPAGYFDRSAAQLANRMLWLEEHREFPALKMAWRDDLFSVPDDYFARNERQLELLPFEKLQSLSGENPFRVPGSYFEDFASFAASPLNAVSRELPLSVPPAYFEDSALRLRKIEKPQQARIISINRRSISFAAAALLIMAAGIWLYNFYVDRQQDNMDCGGIACVDRRDLLDRRNLESLDDDQLYELVNTKALEDKLKDDQPAPVTNDTAVSEEELLDNI